MRAIPIGTLVNGIPVTETPCIVCGGTIKGRVDGDRITGHVNTQAVKGVRVEHNGTVGFAHRNRCSVGLPYRKGNN